MITITLEVSDDLARRLRQAGDRLPQLLSQSLDMAGIPSTTTIPAPLSAAWLEAVDFLAATPTAQDIVDFKLSSVAQERLEDLLQQQREHTLTPHEQAELETYQQINHLFVILKARARANLEKS